MVGVAQVSEPPQRLTGYLSEVFYDPASRCFKPRQIDPFEAAAERLPLFPGTPSHLPSTPVYSPQ